MAKREVDVVIGAKTDDASFRQTEQKTKGFLSRLRGAGPGGAEGALEKSSKMMETMAKVAAVTVVLDQSVRGLGAAFQLADAAMLKSAGKFDQAAAMYEEAASTIRSVPVIGAGFSLGEFIGSKLSGEPTKAELAELEKKRAESEAAYQKSLQATAKEHDARARLEKVIAAGFRERDMAEATNEYDREVLRATAAAEARLRELDVLRDIIQSKRHQRMLEAEDDRVRLNLEKQVEAIRKRQAEHAEKTVRDATQGVMDFFKTGKKEEKEDKTPLPFRAGLPGLTQGLLLSGQATAAQTKSTEAIRRQQTAENTEKNTADTVSVLRQLLEATRGSAAPVLN